MSLHRTLENWWNSGPAPWWGALLRPLAGVYCLIAAHRNRRFDNAELPEAAKGIPVVSIGNVTVGGSGKTPVILDLTARLQTLGLKVAVVSRGYGGSREGVAALEDVAAEHRAEVCGDEPTLIHRQTGAPVVVGSDRVAAANLAGSRYAPDLILLDDALQHRRMRRDLNVVVVGRSGWGNGLCLPAGPLREPVADALKRSDWIVSFAAPPPAATDPLPRIAVHGTPGPWCNGLLEVTESPPQDEPLTLYSAIAAPQRVVASLTGAGYRVERLIEQRDHARIGPEQITAIQNRTTRLWVTTAKDAVRLPADLVADPNLRVVTQSLVWDPSPLITHIQELVSTSKR